MLFSPPPYSLLVSPLHPPRGHGHHRLCLRLRDRHHRALLLLLQGKQQSRVDDDSAARSLAAEL